jgi:hypothetical protein
MERAKYCANPRRGDQMDAIAQQVTLAKLTPKEVHSWVMSMGVSDLDAGLVADCLNVGKSTSWMNNDLVSESINEKMRAFLAEHGYGFEITVTPVRMDKFIWDVKKKR